MTALVGGILVDENQQNLEKKAPNGDHWRSATAAKIQYDAYGVLLRDPVCAAAGQFVFGRARAVEDGPFE